MLYVIAERWPAGARYRDLFEDIRESALSPMPLPEFDQVSPQSYPTGSGVEYRSLDLGQSVAAHTLDQGALEHLLEDIMTGMQGTGGSEPSAWPDLNWSAGELDNLGMPVAECYFENY
jgi:hypothetical protein